jgi:catechol-2,3-dioxygenase
MKEVVVSHDSHGEVAVFLSFGSHHHDVVLIKAKDPTSRKTGDAGMHHAAFGVQGGLEGLRRLYGRLLKNNVEVFKIADHAIGIGIYFLDTDGNKLEFFHDMYPDEEGLKGQALLREQGAPTVSIELTPIY